MKNKIYALIPIIAILVLTIIAAHRNINGEKYIKESIIISDTILNITAKASSKVMRELIDSITNEINRIDYIINPYNENSEISIINKKSLSGVKEMEISDEIARILETGLKYSKLNPSFDVTVRPLIELWGFGIKEIQTVPKIEEIKEVLKNVDCSKLSLTTNEYDKKIIKLEKPLTFDFGAYGKGYIITKLTDIFEDKGVENYLIDYGGDTYSKGLNGRGNPWVIAIRNPRNEDNDSERYLALIRSSNYSIVTSGDYERYFMENGTNYHHIIDAKTGYPSYNSVSATIVHTNAEEADALSTTAFLMGTNFFNDKDFIYKEAYIVNEEGKLFAFTNENF